MKEFNGKKMLDHIFIDRKSGVSKNGVEYDFQTASIHIKRFIDELLQVPTDEKGMGRFNINSRKDDPNKFNFVINDWQPTQTNSTKTQPVLESGSSDDLPF